MSTRVNIDGARARIRAAIDEAERDELTPGEIVEIFVAEIQRLAGNARRPAPDLADTIERAWTNSPFGEPTVIAKVALATIRRGVG